MRKVLFSLILVFSLFCLSACDSGGKTVDNLFAFLQQEDIVDDNLVLVDTVVKINAGIIPSGNSYYIYENDKSELIAINYDTNIYSKNDYDYSVSIYYAVSVNNDIEFYYDDISSENYYSYSDGSKSDSNKYSFENKVDYAVYETKPLFSKTKYIIEYL